MEQSKAKGSSQSSSMAAQKVFTAAVTVVTVMAMVTLMAVKPSEAALSCGSVVSSLSPCRSYLTGGPGPSAACCQGVKNLNRAASTTRDRRTACQCIKTLAQSVKPNPTNSQALPGKCGVKLNVPISTSVNCNTIQ